MNDLYIREAVLNDIPQLQIVRNSVLENALSDPGRITTADYQQYLTQKGKGWVWEEENQIAGFCIVSLSDNNVWALFVLPDFEKKGIGKKLHDAMLQWYFTETQSTLWLSTDPGTKAEIFYRKNGWVETGVYNREIKFEMNYECWKSK